MSELIPGQKGAWHYINEPRNRHLNGKSILGYVDAQGSVKAYQFDHYKSTEHEIVLERDFRITDHSNPVFEILPDGRIMAMWDRSSAIRIAITAKPGDAATFPEDDPIILETLDNSADYSQPIYLPDEDTLYVYTRYDSTDIMRFHMTNVEKRPDQAWRDVSKWSSPIKIWEEDSWSYPHVKQVNENALILARTGNPYNTEDNDLWVARYENGDWYDATGSALAIADDELPLGPNDIDMVATTNKYNTPRLSGMQIGDDGLPYLVYCRFQGEKRDDHLFEYAYPDQSGDWARKEIARSRPIGKESDAYWVYFSGVCLSPRNPEQEVYYSQKRPKGNGPNQHEIFHAETNDGGDNWIATQITFESDEKQIRPRMIRDAHQRFEVAWLSGDLDRHTDYDTEVVSIFAPLEVCQSDG